MREVSLYYPPSSLPSELSLRKEIAIEIIQITWVGVQILCRKLIYYISGQSLEDALPPRRHKV